MEHLKLFDFMEDLLNKKKITFLEDKKSYVEHIEVMVKKKVEKASL